MINPSPQHPDAHPTRKIRGALALLLAAICVPLGSCNDQDETDGRLNTVRVLGEPGTFNGQFVYPRAMDVFEFRGQTLAAVVDKTARVQVLDLDSGEIIGAIHTPRWDRGKPTGLTINISMLDPSKLAIYVADTHEFRVLMYELPLDMSDDPQPTEPDFQFGKYGTDPGQFIYPTDVAIDTNAGGVVERIYVSEYGGNDRVNVFRVDRSGPTPGVVWERQIGVVGEEVDASDDPLALARPQSIELWKNPSTGRSEVVLTDAGHHRVGRIGTDGELIAWFGDPLDVSDEAYRFPYGLTLLDDGTALVSEFGANRVRRIDLESGETLFRYGVAGRSVGQLAQPWAVARAGEKIVILDSGNSRIQICDLPSGSGPVAQEYTRPIPSANTGSIGDETP